MSEHDQLNEQITNLEEQIQKIKDQLMAIGDMRPGNLTEQKHPSKSANHPYYQLSYTHKNRSRTEYIREAFLEDIRHEISEYELFRKLTAQWTDLAVEKAAVKLKLLRATTPRAKRRPTPRKTG